MNRIKTFRAEQGPTLRLALPLVLAELGWMSMTIVDTMMVGRLPNSAVAMGAVSLGSNLFTAIALFGGGLLMGLDTLVSQAFGAGRREDCHRSLVNSVYLSIVLTPLLAIPVWILPALLRAMRVDSGVLALAIPYTKALLAGLFPLLLYFAVRRCIQAMNMAKPVAFALVTANIVNAFGNWTLIYGKFGMPAMGAIGSGWSTSISRTYMALVLVGYLFWYDFRHGTELLKTPIEPDFRRIRRLIALGFPAAMQFTFESGVFALTTPGRPASCRSSNCAEYGCVHVYGSVGSCVGCGCACRSSHWTQGPARCGRRGRHCHFSRCVVHDLHERRPSRLSQMDRPRLHAG
jgi:multidrug resistance protein, MATE family